MPKKYTMYESDMPELAGNRFLTPKDVLEAENAILSQKGMKEELAATEQGKQQSTSAMQAIGKMGQTLSDYDVSARVRGGLDEESKAMLSADMPEKVVKNVGIFDPEGAASLQRMGEHVPKYGAEKPELMPLARMTGITASPAPEAKEFVSGLEKQATIESRENMAEENRRLKEEMDLMKADAAQKRTETMAGSAMNRTLVGTGARKDEKATAEKEKDDMASLERGDTIDLIDRIKNNPNAATGYNPMSLLSGVRGTKQYAFASDVQKLVDKVALNNRGKLKGTGQISDIEQKMLKNAGTNLSTKLGKEEFLAELENLRNVIIGIGKVQSGGGSSEDDPLGLGL